MKTASLINTALPFTRQGAAMLVVVDGPDEGRSLTLGERPVVLGSASSCDLVLSDGTVSRRHLVAARTASGLLLSDQESKNGSFIDDNRFQEITIGYGGEFRVGKTRVKYLPREQIVEPEPSDKPGYGALVGDDRGMRQVFHLLTSCADEDVTVLVEGETGTGKELIAEELHAHSNRSDRPFVIFDCGAVAENLVASALFGHVKGAFTGAVASQQGAFRAADGGTLFLDEIGELPLEVQSSLLRALDKKSVSPVGATDYQAVDVRVVAATNRHLADEVNKGAFREDLYYRLSVIRLAVPPLRDRGHDVKIIAEHFLQRFARGRPLRFSPQAEAKLLEYGWPGNVRELRNVVQRACILSDGDEIDFDEESFRQRSGEEGVPLRLPYKEARGIALEQFERSYLEHLLKKHPNNLSEAARQAGINRKSLYELVKKHGLD